MASLLDRVRTALKRPTSDATQLAAAVTDARRAEADAIADVERAVAAVAAGYLDSADRRANARAALSAAREVAEDASLVLAEVERRHGAAVTADEDARRRAAYDAAQAQAAAASADLAKLYPRLATDLVALLGRVAAAQQSVAAVNADLPTGAAPIADPESTARGFAGLPREVLSEAEVVLWKHETGREPLPADRQGEVVPRDHGFGIAPGAHQAYLRRHRFIRREVREPVPSFDPVPLAAALQVPRLDGRGLLWDPSPSAALEPAEVLARVEAIKAEVVAPPMKLLRPSKVEWDDLGGVDAHGVTWVEGETTKAQPTRRASRFGASPFSPAGARGGRR